MQERHCIEAVRWMDSLLLARPTENEGHLDLLQSVVLETQGFQMDKESQTGNVRMIFSDTPAKLGNPMSMQLLTKLEFIATGLLHIALKIERGYGKNESELTLLLRRCLMKLRQMGNGSSSYFRSVVAVPQLPSMLDLRSSLSAGKVHRKRRNLWNVTYRPLPYAHARDFLDDVTALTLEFKTPMTRKSHKTSTVLSSLVWETSGIQLQYVLNGSRFICQNRQLSVPREPTACDAAQCSLVRYFRGVNQQTLRHLTWFSFVFEFRAPPHGMVARTSLSRVFAPSSLLFQLYWSQGCSGVSWSKPLVIR